MGVNDLLGMESALHYNYRDILGVPARALSAKRILVMTVFIVAGLVVYDLFTYAALAVDGEPLGTYWTVFGLLPVTFFKLRSALAGVLYGVGIILALLALMMGMFGVAAIETEQIRGNRFFSAWGAIKFALRRFTQILVSELSIMAFLALIVVLILILGLVTRLPVVGEWIYTLTFLVPSFIVALFTVFILAVLQASIILGPAVASTERNGEAFSVILMTFSTIVRQPVRWVVYTAYGIVVAKLASFVYAYFCYRAVQFLAWCTSLTAGDKAIKLIRSGLSHLPVTSDVAEETFRVFPGVDWSFSIAQWARGGGDEAAGHLMAAMLFLIFASVIAYALAIVATGQTRAYAVIRFIKDEYRICEEKPMFFEEEHINEPIEESGS